MCGVIGLVYERDRADLGKIATDLLRTLEYRGYDSTGAVIQATGGAPVLRKGVGAPSKVAGPLGIPQLGGRVFCGQVRWATFGAVDEANAQPHEVRCHVHLYGAHNGNVTNCDDLQRWLRSEGHDVRSDNDGEMVVHAVEHFYAAALAGQPAEARGEAEVRRTCMRRAIREAGARMVGSFAAVIVEPTLGEAWAIKAGSSLYFGLGEDAIGGRFAIASSDLSSVLRLTHQLVPIVRDDVVEFGAAGHRLFRLGTGEVVARDVIRSRLLAQDIALQPPFETFMEQEIAAQDRTVGKVIAMFDGGSPRLQRLEPVFAALSATDRGAIDAAVHALSCQTSDAGLRHALAALEALPAFTRLFEAAGPMGGDTGPLVSSDAAVLLDLRETAAPGALALIDAWSEGAEVRDVSRATTAFAERCVEVQSRGGRIYVVCCGSSYNAARAGALFFNEIAQVQLLPMLPGDFRGQCLGSVQPGDLFVAVSQSGETKDVVDVMTSLPRGVVRISLVNNVNSTIAQELSDVVLPLHCGPEIAVPATKSFMNQMAVLYGLALRVAERRGLDVTHRAAAMRRLPELLRTTIAETAAAIDEAAALLYLEPSIHLLATRISAVAKEGALKIREVVLNHTEGFEGSEFKHGPNTILGLNTLYGPSEVHRLLSAWARLAPDLDPSSLLDPERAVAAGTRSALLDALRSHYPLVYVTGPGEQDVQLTVSQINTHKIRGASTVVIAEEDPALRQAATKAPNGSSTYRAVVVALPATGDHLLTMFTATVALQRLALVMSVRKARWLDALGLADHGVHPDVPKNVSKSITVD